MVVEGEALVGGIVGGGGQDAVAVDADASAVGIVGVRGGRAVGSGSGVGGEFAGELVEGVVAIGEGGGLGLQSGEATGGIVIVEAVRDLGVGSSAVTDLADALERIVGDGAVGAVGVGLLDPLMAGIIAESGDAARHSLGGGTGVLDDGDQIAGIVGVGLTSLPALEESAVAVGIVAVGDGLSVGMSGTDEAEEAVGSVVGEGVQSRAVGDPGQLSQRVVGEGELRAIGIESGVLIATVEVGVGGDLALAVLLHPQTTNRVVAEGLQTKPTLDC